MMRRRESVTTAPHPGLAAIKDTNLNAILRDIYDHLYLEPATAEVAQSAAGQRWTDRGDPATSDWDEGDLTADGSWHDLSLSAIVPAGAALVLLRVVLIAGSGDEGQCYFRKADISSLVNVSAVMEISDDQGRDVWVTPDGNGKIEYKLDFVNTPEVDITVAGWFA